MSTKRSSYTLSPARGSGSGSGSIGTSGLTSSKSPQGTPRTKSLQHHSSGVASPKQVKSGSSTPTASSPPASFRPGGGISARKNASGTATMTTLDENSLADFSPDVLKAAAERLSGSSAVNHASSSPPAIDVGAASPVNASSTVNSARSSLTVEKDTPSQKTRHAATGVGSASSGASQVHDPEKHDAYTKHLHDVIRELQLKNQELMHENQDKAEAIYSHAAKAKEREQAHAKHIRLYQALFASLLTNQFIKSWKTKQVLFRLQELMFGLIQPIIREYKLNPSMSTTFDSNTASTLRSKTDPTTKPQSTSAPEGVQTKTVVGAFTGQKSMRATLGLAVEAGAFLTDKQREELEREKELNALYMATASASTPSAPMSPTQPNRSASALLTPNSARTTTPRSPSFAVTVTPAAASEMQTLALPSVASGIPSNSHNSSGQNDLDQLDKPPPPSSRRANKHVQQGEDLSAPHLQLDVTVDDVTRIARFKKVKKGARLIATPIIDLTCYLEDVFTICQQALINLLSRLPQARLEAENLAQRNVELTEKLLELETSKKQELKDAYEWKGKYDTLLIEFERIKHSYSVVKGDYDHALKHIGPLRKGRETRIDSMAGIHVSKTELLPQTGRLSRSPSPLAAGTSRVRSRSRSARSPSPGGATTQVGGVSSRGGAGSAARAVEHLRSLNIGLLQHAQQLPDDSQRISHAHRTSLATYNDDGAETDFLFDRPLTEMNHHGSPSSMHPPHNTPLRPIQTPAEILRASLAEFKEEYSPDEQEVYASIVQMKQEQDLSRNFKQLLAERATASEEELAKIKQGRTIQSGSGGTAAQTLRSSTHTGRSAGRERSAERFSSRSPARGSSANGASSTKRHTSRSRERVVNVGLDDPSDTSGVRSTSLNRPRPHSALYSTDMMKQAQGVREGQDRRGSARSPVRAIDLQDRYAQREIPRTSLRETSPGKPTSSFTSNKKFDTRDIGGTNIYLGLTADPNANSHTPAKKEFRNKDSIFSSYGYADGRNMVQLPGTGYQVRKEKERVLQSIQNKGGSTQLVSSPQAQQEKPKDSSSFSSPSTTGSKVDRPSSSPMQQPRRETYFEHVLASPLNTPLAASSTQSVNLTQAQAERAIQKERERLTGSRPGSSTGTTMRSSRSTKELSGGSRPNTGSGARSKHSSAGAHSHTHSSGTLFSPSSAVAAALAGVDGVDTEELPDDPNQPPPNPFLPRAPTVQEQNARTKDAIQYVFDPEDDEEDMALRALRDNSVLAAQSRTTVKFPAQTSSSEQEYEDSILIVKGNQSASPAPTHGRSDSTSSTTSSVSTYSQDRSRPTSAYATVGGKIQRMALATPKEKPAPKSSVLHRDPPAVFFQSRTAVEEAEDIMRSPVASPQTASSTQQIDQSAYYANLSVDSSELIISSPSDPFFLAGGKGSSIRHITSKNSFLPAAEEPAKAKSKKKSVTGGATGSGSNKHSSTATKAAPTAVSAATSKHSSSRSQSSVIAVESDSGRVVASSSVAVPTISSALDAPKSPKTPTPPPPPQTTDIASILAQSTDFESYVREIEAEREASVFGHASAGGNGQPSARDSTRDSARERTPLQSAREATPVQSARQPAPISTHASAQPSAQPSPRPMESLQRQPSGSRSGSATPAQGPPSNEQTPRGDVAKLSVQHQASLSQQHQFAPEPPAAVAPTLSTVDPVTSSSPISPEPHVHPSPEVAAVKATNAPAVVSTPHPQKAAGFTFAVPSSAPALTAPVNPTVAAIVASGSTPQHSRSPSTSVNSSGYSDDFQDPDAVEVPPLGPSKALGAVVEEGDEDDTEMEEKKPRTLSASERFKALKAKRQSGGN